MMTWVYDVLLQDMMKRIGLRYPNQVDALFHESYVNCCYYGVVETSRWTLMPMKLNITL